jgi:hypothetical protein
LHVFICLSLYPPWWQSIHFYRLSFMGTHSYLFIYISSQSAITSTELSTCNRDCLACYLKCLQKMWDSR